ncbi:Isoepoxydon dehydrogenase patN [Fusarium oxysporum f. sp. albedinis]|nr:Isoepoxydon dehydrogenase patN [Fusarium oxysporum f. sp. albedinis]
MKRKWQLLKDPGLEGFMYIRSMAIRVLSAFIRPLLMVTGLLTRHDVPLLKDPNESITVAGGMSLAAFTDFHIRHQLASKSSSPFLSFPSISGLLIIAPTNHHLIPTSHDPPQCQIIFSS